MRKQKYWRTNEKLYVMAPCHFGLEAVLVKGNLDVRFELHPLEDGRVTFEGDDEGICEANIF